MTNNIFLMIGVVVYVLLSLFASQWIGSYAKRRLLDATGNNAFHYPRWIDAVSLLAGLAVLALAIALIASGPEIQEQAEPTASMSD